MRNYDINERFSSIRGFLWQLKQYPALTITEIGCKRTRDGEEDESMHKYDYCQVSFLITNTENDNSIKVILSCDDTGRIGYKKGKYYFNEVNQNSFYLELFIDLFLQNT